MPLNEDSSKLLVFLGRSNDCVVMFGIPLAPSKCKMVLPDWIRSTPNLVFAR